MDLSVIYVNYNVDDLLLKSIQSVLKNKAGLKIEIIVVDNSPKKNLQEKLQKKNVIYIKSDSNLGFGKANNLAAKKAKGKYFLFLNPDTVVDKNSLALMLQYMKENKDVGVIGPKILSEDGSLQPSISTKHTRISHIAVYSFLNSLWKNNPFSKKFWMYEEKRKTTTEVDVVSGACMLIPSKVFKKSGGFDRRFFLYFEEHDLCVRIKKLGYKIIFLPKARITHLKGGSLKDKKIIKKYFENSRYQYSKKYFGASYALVSEIFLRYFTADNLIFFFVFLASLFINTYRMDSLMLFIGDIARDFLIAREVVLGNVTLPIVGIPSSVTWLHQGPLAQWLVFLSLNFTNFNPIAPGILFGLINAFASGLLFILGKKYFSRIVGFFAAMFYIVSPAAVINARMPYHTSLIPLTAIIFFIVLPEIFKNKKFLILLSFLFGLLLLTELSNAVVFLIVLILFLIYRGEFKVKTIFYSFFAFLLGVLPFILYDLLNGPTYLKFPVWIIYRIFKFAEGKGGGSGLVNNLFTTFYQQISGSIMPQLKFLPVLFFIAAIIFIFSRSRSKTSLSERIILLWVIVPLSAFIMHNAPGTAYFALLYPAISLTLAYFVYHVLKARIGFIIILFIFIFNLKSLFINDFYINTSIKNNYMPPTNYSYGNSYLSSKNAAIAINKVNNGKTLLLKPYGSTSLYATSLDPYKFFLLKDGLRIDDSSQNVYFVVEDNATIYGTQIIYKDRLVKVMKK